ncbi:pentatricopeptide repeat-containing protein At5g61370, mitochondrial [Typha angustifolia]|uniref:pentatricopeptide repeat-containing protein At5g61370, mitochondrial n=1 Tax=Typha angustifolia TaxID=59011 RepID=UPI003C2D7283
MMRVRLLANGFQIRSSFASFLHTNSLADFISSGVGSLDDLESHLNNCSEIPITHSLITQVIDSCTNTSTATTSRRLLRFFSWCHSKNPSDLGADVFNRAIRAFASMGDLTAVGVAVSDLQKAGHVISPETFAVVVDTLVKAGKEDDAVKLFRCLERKKMLPNSSSLNVVQALCSKGHARKAEGVVYHHKDELSKESMAIVVQRSLLHGWCVNGNAREARRVMEEMKSQGIPPSLLSYNDLLRCVCHRNLKFNPSALVSEATDILTEMRSSGVSPTAASFNILLSHLGSAKRVKEAYRVLYLMREGKASCAPDWVSYFLVVRVLYLTGRFVRGNRLVDQMLKDGLAPGAKFYHGLIGVLCGVEKVDHALLMFDRMRKRVFGQDCGPTYDLLIEKLCRSGGFEEGTNLWDEAVQRGIALECSSDLLDPSKTKVFKPTRPLKNLQSQDYKKVGYKVSKVLVKPKRRLARKKDQKA